MGCCGGSYLTGGETRRDHVVVVLPLAIMSRSRQIVYSCVLAEERLGDNSDIVNEKH